MRRLIAALVVVWAVPTMAAAETVVVTAERMIDVAAGRVVEAPIVVFTDGRIASVSARGVIPAGIPADARRIDLPGHTILPGLIDLHVHRLENVAGTSAAMRAATP
jgi:imidazolonepropionase-like amidohydrolase